MKKSLLFILILFISIPFLASREELLPQHKEWLEIVSPIITKTEREIFLKLRTKEERDKFIQFFWRQRDPLPDTSDNEFFKEYMERVRFADRNFGYGSSKRGCQTERGYYYLLLGPPLERTFFTTQSELWPLELWYYKGDVNYGLPPYFYLIFYQPQGLGEFRLYSPGVEGPETLIVTPFDKTTLSRNAAFQVIKKISGELADASLSYLPGERTLEESPFSSDLLISSIHSLPNKIFTDSYARSYLKYKDYVETDYSHDFIESNYKVKVFKNENQFYLHWAVEPKKISFASLEEKYYASFELILRIEDMQGNLVLEKDEEIPLKITQEQYRAHAQQIFAFQDILPIIPGDFRLFFLLKNKTAKDFTSFTTEVTVPQEQKSLNLSNLLLYHNREKNDESKAGKLQAFSFCGNHYLITTRDEFLPQEKMGFYLQVFNLDEKIRDRAESVLLEIRSFDTGQTAMDFKKNLAEVLCPDGIGVDMGTVSLATLKPGYYQAELSLQDKDSHKILLAKENFVLLSQASRILPWVYSKFHNSFPSPEQLYILGSQYFMTKKYEKASDLLKSALKLKDESRSRTLLARALYALGNYQESLLTVLPVYQANPQREVAMIISLNYAGLRDWPSALIYLERIITEVTEISSLNLAAECYLNLNQPEKALPLLQKSLRINPDQEHIRELEEKVRKLLKSQ